MTVRARLGRLAGCTIPLDPPRLLGASGSSCGRLAEPIVEHRSTHWSTRSRTTSRSSSSPGSGLSSVRGDVLHLHWPESLLRASGRAKKWAKYALFLALMTRVAVGKPGVWTVHNESPHERGARVEAFLLGLWSRVTRRNVYLYPSVTPADQRSVFIPFGDYSHLADELLTTYSREREPRRILLFGCSARTKASSSSWRHTSNWWPETPTPLSPSWGGLSTTHTVAQSRNGFTGLPPRFSRRTHRVRGAGRGDHAQLIRGAPLPAHVQLGSSPPGLELWNPDPRSHLPDDGRPPGGVRGGVGHDVHRRLDCRHSGRRPHALLQYGAAARVPVGLAVALLVGGG